MLLQLITSHPEAIAPILARTPSWVWGLLAGLLWLGIAQTRDRDASATRIATMPLGMAGFSIFGLLSAFGTVPHMAQLLLVWLAAAAALLAVVGAGKAEAHYDSARRSFRLPGSWVPLALILCIFLTRYIVGVELAMQPPLASDTQFTLVVAALYGAFSGVFAGRAARLLRLAGRAPVAPLHA